MGGSGMMIPSARALLGKRKTLIDSRNRAIANWIFMAFSPGRKGSDLTSCRSDGKEAEMVPSGIMPGQNFETRKTIRTTNL
jgi:hypothetical protein